MKITLPHCAGSMHSLLVIWHPKNGWLFFGGKILKISTVMCCRDIIRQILVYVNLFSRKTSLWSSEVKRHVKSRGALQLNILNTSPLFANDHLNFHVKYANYSILIITGSVIKLSNFQILKVKTWKIWCF